MPEGLFPVAAFSVPRIRASVSSVVLYFGMLKYAGTVPQAIREFRLEVGERIFLRNGQRHPELGNAPFRRVAVERRKHVPDGRLLVRHHFNVIEIRLAYAAGRAVRDEAHRRRLFRNRGRNTLDARPVVRALERLCNRMRLPESRRSCAYLPQTLWNDNDREDETQKCETSVARV